jgi:hypothetical protein
MTGKRMDNVGIVVESIGAAIDFFTELGLERPTTRFRAVASFDEGEAAHEILRVPERGAPESSLSGCELRLGRVGTYDRPALAPGDVRSSAGDR